MLQDVNFTNIFVDVEARVRRFLYVGEYRCVVESAVTGRPAAAWLRPARGWQQCVGVCTSSVHWGTVVWSRRVPGVRERGGRLQRVRGPRGVGQQPAQQRLVPRQRRARTDNVSLAHAAHVLRVCVVRHGTLQSGLLLCHCCVSLNKIKIGIHEEVYTIVKES